ncbi:MAG: SIS domain-containing protein [Armatimonadaceae bacterium]
MSVLHQEIFEQPAALERAITTSREGVSLLVEKIQRRDIRFVVLAARGTSDNAATYAKYLLQIVCGIPVALAAPSVHTMYGATVDYSHALVVGVSQSGRGEDVNEVVAQARRTGALTAAITNTPDSPLAGVAEHVLHCNAGVEKAVAATKTYTTTLAIFARLAAAWSENAELAENLEALPERAQKALEVEAQTANLARTLLHAERVLTVARGLHLCTAIEAALKIAETTYTTTQAFSSADLLHGPIASVATQTPCLLFRPQGKTAEMMAGVGQTLSERGARVITLSPEAAGPDSLPLTDPGTELLAPVLDIFPAQLIAYHLTVARGLDPDQPQGLSKVTITR